MSFNEKMTLILPLFSFVRSENASFYHSEEISFRFVIQLRHKRKPDFFFFFFHSWREIRSLEDCIRLNWWFIRFIFKVNICSGGSSVFSLFPNEWSICDYNWGLVNFRISKIDLLDQPWNNKCWEIQWAMW